MGIELIGLITIALGGIAVLRSSAMSLTVLCCVGLLQAASAMAFGQANITPGHLSVAFFVLAILIREYPFRFGMMVLQPGRPGLILAALSLWAVASGILMPRLFAGAFFVFPMSSVGLIREIPLYPQGSNFNQTVYFVAGLVIFLSVSSMVRTPQSMARAAMAIMICALLNIAIVLVDTVTFAVGLSTALDFIRNADYSQLFSHHYMGVKRITGSYPEASSFASASAGLFAFNFRLWRSGIRPKLTGIISALTFAAILFSFSSTGYVTVLCYLAFAYALTASGIDTRTRGNPFAAINRRLFVSFGPLLAILVAASVAVRPDLLDPVMELFDRSIASKLDSASGVERSSWNEAGLRAFFETYGLGAGVGSSRTSSFVVGVLSNVGIIGAVLFAMYFYSLFRSKPELRTPLADEETRVYASAARAGCFSILLAACVSSSVIDLGIHFYVMAGMACASLFYRPAAMVQTMPEPRPIEPLQPNRV